MTGDGGGGEPTKRRSERRRPRHVLAFGTLALDSVATPHGSRQDVPGGSALYFSAAASLMAPVRLVGVVGADFPAACLDWLRERSIDVTGIRREPGPTMRWRARYAPDLQTRETLETHRGVGATTPPTVPPAATETPVAFLGSTDPRQQDDVLDQLLAPQVVGLDTMGHWIGEQLAHLRRLLARTHVLFVNATEARALAGATRPAWRGAEGRARDGDQERPHGGAEGRARAGAEGRARAGGEGRAPGEAEDLRTTAALIRESGPTWVVVKLGPAGARAYGPSCMLAVPAAPVSQVRDPTGAGDAFAGGVIGYLAGAGAVDLSAMKAALRFGAAAASLAVERFGIEGFTTADLAELDSRARGVTLLPGEGPSS